MKKLLVALAAIVSFTIPAFAQSNKPNKQDNVSKKPVVCYPTADLFTVVQEKFKEEVAFVVAHEYSDETLVAMFVNLEKGTYTLVEFNNETACVLASGAGFKLQPLKPPGIPI